MYWREKKRVPLKEGAKLIINGITVVNDDKREDVSEGSSCLVYHGHLENDSQEGIVENQVVIKEFYPDVARSEVVFDIERSGDTNILTVSECTKEKESYQTYYKQFQQGFSFQRELSSSEAMEIAVKPLIYGKAGDSCYVISDIHRGKDLKKEPPKTLEEKLSVAVGIAETMSILHESGYVMLDFKPENFLWIKKPNIIKIIDTDSLVPFRNNADISKLQLFVTPRMQAPEIQFLKDSIAAGISERELERKKKFYLRPEADLYIIGKYLYELFWEKELLEADIDKLHQEELEKTFIELYKNDAAGKQDRLHSTAKALIEMLRRLVVVDLTKRKMKGYRNAKALRNALNEVSLGYSSQNYVPRKEIAKANATFIGYHMLQKYPLYEYADIIDGVRQLHVTVAGNHGMRKEILSALISIGQMLDSKLTINVISRDAKDFWDNYISEDCNPGLVNAVTWSVDGEVISDRIDPYLVDQSLAHINLFTSEEERLTMCQKEGSRYFIFLSEDANMNKKWLQLLEAQEVEKELFAGCLHGEADWSKDSQIILHPINGDCYSENYNENIFNEKIFQMGLMVHAYYCGCLDNIDSVDITQLEKEFSRDLYNVESSERCALHAMYKMACVGLAGNIPRKAVRFEKMMDQEPQLLENLSWLEHLSWTASLLTTGAKMERMDQFDCFAYQGKNDWKNRFDPNHMGHPLLVSSRKELQAADWTLKETASQLDELDLVSHKIYHWYIDHKEMFREKMRNLLAEWKRETEEEVKLLNEMNVVMERCIDGIGKKAMNQDTTDIKIWKQLMEEAKLFDKKQELWCELQNAMRPVIDSYKDRDYKQLDRNMVYAAASIAG